jgi:hypothetical protein
MHLFRVFIQGSWEFVEGSLLTGIAHTHTQYIRSCIAKGRRAQLSIKNFQELVPIDKDQFIAPVFSHTASATKFKKSGTTMICSRPQ